MIDIKLLKGLERKRVIDNYNGQKSMAKKRGIAWQFTRESWLAWWGDDYALRGQGRGKLCCARKNDSGPYSPENCIKLTHEENSKQCQARRREQGYTSSENSVYIPMRNRKGLPRELYRAKPMHTPYGDFPSMSAAERAMGLNADQLRAAMKKDPSNFYLLDK